jgi:hypothetical protein
MIVIDNHIVILNFYFCTLTAIEFGCGYRLGQTIALMMALDRFIAIWRPTIYAKRQGSVNFLCRSYSHRSPRGGGTVPPSLTNHPRISRFYSHSSIHPEGPVYSPYWQTIHTLLFI